MTSDEIRKSFLSFFEEKGHKVIPSSSLVPHGDPTLLLTTAGMVQLKPYFQGESLPQGWPPRLASCQKCFRTTDMVSVGDTKHLTFFEMLGNFSIGDYFKREAIAWAWEYVTKRLKLPPERLWITVFQDDDEAFQYWREVGVPEERIRRCGEKDNFWGPAGDMGPCGPCSEIHYDFGEGVGCGRTDCAPNCDCPRFLEIWNLVFTQFFQDRDGKRTPLPRPNIDTGMGLERMAAVMQGKISVYDTDLFAPLVAKVCDLSGVKLGQDAEKDRAARIVAEHSRGIAFLIADGVVPSNEGRGYVLRRLLRRASLFGRKLGVDKPFLTELAQIVIKQMGHVYPEIQQSKEFVLRVVGSEEAKFQETLDNGLNILSGMLNQRTDAQALIGGRALRAYSRMAAESATNPKFVLLRNSMVRSILGQMIEGALALKATGLQLQRDEALGRFEANMVIAEAIKQFQADLDSSNPGTIVGVTDKKLRELERIVSSLSGSEVFLLYDTYGFPPELTEEIAREHGLSVDMAGFEAEMAKQRERARAAQKFAVGERQTALDYASLSLPATEFVGYENTRSQARILSLAVEGQPQEVAAEGQEVEIVLDRTPFYAEMGGQVADTGRIRGGRGGEVEVSHVLWGPGDAIVHRGRVVRGAIAQGETVTAEVEEGVRLDIARNHTATHLLQAALRKVLGSHVQQRGSLVATDRLRFDFSHLEALKEEEIRQVEGLVNGWIRQDLPVKSQKKPLQEALKEGAIAFFGEKYGEEVRAVEIGQPAVSMELCGGTHLRSTGEIGFFLMVSEGSIGAGLRRIEAVTGRGAESYVRQRLSAVEALARELQTTPDEVRSKVQALRAQLDEAEKRAQALERELLKKTAEALLGQVESVNGVAVLSARVAASGPEALREMGDWLKERLKSAIIVLGAIYDDRPNFVALVTPDLVKRGFHAAEIAKQVAAVAGGSGGGRPGLAQAGGKDKTKLDEALRQVRDIVAQAASAQERK